MSDTDAQVPLPDLNAADAPPVDDVAYNEDDQASRVAAVGQMKSAIAGVPAATTWSHSHPMRRACSMRSSTEKPRSPINSMDSPVLPSAPCG